MRRKRKVYGIIILLMAIGFAAVAANLFINGTTYISGNDDFSNSIIFTKASVDTEGIANISNDNKSLSFTTGNLKNVGDTAKIKYTVTNFSEQYDADVDIVYDIVTAGGNELINIDNNINNILPANSSEEGILTITLKKVVTEPIDIVIDCEIDAVAISRDFIANNNNEIESPNEKNDQQNEENTYNSKENINLYNKIVSLSTGETISDLAINSTENDTNGIYETIDTDSGNKVYYYRGVVDNNIVFGDSCYMIVRTTETNGIKLLYNGDVDSNDRCVSPNNNKDELDVSANDNVYMYGDGENYFLENKYSSEAKIKNDTWYEDNILNKNLAGYIEDTVYCVNRNILEISTYNNRKGYTFEINNLKTKYYDNRGDFVQAGNVDATLKCVNKDNADNGIDRFTVSTSNGNGALTYPVGLLSTNEVFYGGVTDRFNSSEILAPDIRKGYLWDYNYYYLLSDPAYYYITNGTESTYFNEFFNYTNGVASDGDITAKIRPVISLKSDTQIHASGDGTKKNPYRVILN